MPQAARNSTTQSAHYNAGRMQATSECLARAEETVCEYEARVVGQMLDLVNTACCAGCIILLSHKPYLYTNTL